MHISSLIKKNNSTDTNQTYYACLNLFQEAFKSARVIERINFFTNLENDLLSKKKRTEELLNQAKSEIFSILGVPAQFNENFEKGTIYQQTELIFQQAFLAIRATFSDLKKISQASSKQDEEKEALKIVITNLYEFIKKEIMNTGKVIDQKLLKNREKREQIINKSGIIHPQPTSAEKKIIEKLEQNNKFLDQNNKFLDQFQNFSIDFEVRLGQFKDNLDRDLVDSLDTRLQQLSDIEELKIEFLERKVFGLKIIPYQQYKFDIETELHENNYNKYIGDLNNYLKQNFSDSIVEFSKNFVNIQNNFLAILKKILDKKFKINLESSEPFFKEAFNIRYHDFLSNLKKDAEIFLQKANALPSNQDLNFNKDDVKEGDFSEIEVIPLLEKKLPVLQHLLNKLLEEQVDGQPTSFEQDYGVYSSKLQDDYLVILNNFLLELKFFRLSRHISGTEIFSFLSTFHKR